jgi:hypothetical protein
MTVIFFKTKGLFAKVFDVAAGDQSANFDTLAVGSGSLFSANASDAKVVLQSRKSDSEEVAGRSSIGEPSVADRIPKTRSCLRHPSKTRPTLRSLSPVGSQSSGNWQHWTV